jgi:ribokinase
VDILTPNESELRILCGRKPDDSTDSLELARNLQGRGVRRIVLTLGAGGALIVDERGKAEEIGGRKVDVKDTTGAGDSFNAALAVALARGKSLNDAVRFATYAGAYTCTKLGVINGLPYPADIEGLMADGKAG